MVRFPVAFPEAFSVSCPCPCSSSPALQFTPHLTLPLHHSLFLLLTACVLPRSHTVTSTHPALPAFLTCVLSMALAFETRQRKSLENLVCLSVIKHSQRWRFRVEETMSQVLKSLTLSLLVANGIRPGASSMGWPCTQEVQATARDLIFLMALPALHMFQERMQLRLRTVGENIS